MPEQHSSSNTKKCYFPKRYILVFLAFLGFFNVMALRYILSVTMVAMVNSTTVSSANASYRHDEECPELTKKDRLNYIESYKGEKYDWDLKTQSIILGAFFYSYVVSQAPGGILAEKFGFKRIFGCGIMVTSVLSLLTPFAASWSTTALIVLRVLEGFGEGVTFPAINCAISIWSPRSERSRASTIINSGGLVGNVVAMAASGVMCNSDALGGWPSVFYVFGGIGCVWFILWCIMIHETPVIHPNISKEELNFIEQNKDKINSKEVSIPWRKMFTSVPVWAVIIAMFGNSFGFLIMLAEMPTFLSTALHYDIQSNGLLSALPYIAQALSAWISSYIADKLREKNTLSVTTIRKLFNSIGMFGLAFCLIGITFCGCRPELIVVLLTLGIGIDGCFYSGYNVTPIDLCPDFAGTIYGISNSIASLNGFLGPMVVSIFISKGATISNWNNVFYTAAAVNIIAGSTFAIFGSAELQPWVVTKNKSKTDFFPQNKLNAL